MQIRKIPHGKIENPTAGIPAFLREAGKGPGVAPIHST